MTNAICVSHSHGTNWACKNVPALHQDKDMAPFDRITQNPDVMGGKPSIRGMRVTVGIIVSQIGSGQSIEDLLADHPYLEREDILQALRYRQHSTD